MSDMDILRAAAIANASEWSGDPRVNLNTAIGAARVLAKAVEFKQDELATLQAKHERLREAVGQILPHLIGQREVTIGREEWDYLNQIAESEGE